MSFIKYIPTFIGIISTLFFTVDTMLGGGITSDLIEVIGDSAVIDTVSEYVSVIGSGVLNSFSHFDLFSLFTRDNIAFLLASGLLCLFLVLFHAFQRKDLIMDNIKLVINLVSSFFNTRLSFGSVSFSIWQYFFALFILSAIFYAIKRLFE